MERFKADSRQSRLFARGYPSILATHLIWGMLPLYFAVTPPASAFEVVAVRVLFSLIFCAFLAAVLGGGLTRLKGPLWQRSLLFPLVLASLLVGANWLIYVLAVTSGNTLEASLGYFINPLVSVFLGVIFLGERLRPVQWLAVILAGAAVVSMSILYGRVPWIGLGLAASFGFYGLVKSKVGGRVSPLHSFTLESLFLTPIATAVLIALAQAETLTLFAHGAGHFGVLAASGIVTALPLLFFAHAVSRLPLSVVGMMQYISPTLQFLIALYVFHEPLSRERLLGFIVIWCACLLFGFDSIRAARARKGV